MKKFWFKAKEYGWGWYPATWHGWTIILGYFVILAILVIIFETDIQNFLYFYLISVFVITVCLVYVCYKTGEKPRWRWGKKK